MKCKLCSTETSYFDNAIIMGRHNICYYRCPHCGFIQTEDPYWLTEAYSDAIADSDIGLISRNIHLSSIVDSILKILNPVNGLLDYGGGYGIFVRMMRDKGWNFEWYDKYCQNLFAKGHEMAHLHYEIATSFEMIEHLPHPMSTFEAIFNIADTLICTTEIISMSPPKVNEWWYYATESGQHVSFYTKESLQIIAQKFKKKLYTGHGIIIFSDNEIPFKKINLTFNHPRLANFLFNLQSEKTSLLSEDYLHLTEKGI